MIEKATRYAFYRLIVNMRILTLTEWNWLVNEHNNGNQEIVTQESDLFDAMKTNQYLKNWCRGCESPQFIFFTGEVGKSEKLCLDCKKQRHKQYLKKNRDKFKPQNLPSKICPVCQRAFTPIRLSKKTCSDKCRKQASLKKIDLP